MELDQILYISYTDFGKKKKKPMGSSPGSSPVVGQTEGRTDKVAT